MKTRKSARRRTEYVDPNPMTLPVKFQKPPTLAEQIARYMGAHSRFQEAQGDESPDEADDFEIQDDDGIYSPHELVRDELLNKDLTRYEKQVLDVQRAKFDQDLQARIREAKKEKALIASAQKSLAERKSKKSESIDEE